MTIAPDDYKQLIADIGKLIDARHKTLQSHIKGYVDLAISASEKRIRNDMATKDTIAEVRGELKELFGSVTVLEGKVTILDSKLDRLDRKMDVSHKDYKDRLESIERELELSHDSKN